MRMFFDRCPGRAYTPLVFLGLFLYALPMFATAENIDAYTVHVELAKNGSLAVQEEIIYNFGTTERHGIFRHIPLVYRPQGELSDAHIELSSIMVTDGRGNFIPTSYQGGGNYVEFKIGDPDKIVTGPQFYVIRYTVWGAVRFAPYEDVLYWNITSNDWSYPITRARAEFVLPKPILRENLTIACSFGALGQMLSCGEGEAAVDAGTGGVTQLVFEQAGLRAHDAMGITIKIPKGVLVKSAPTKSKTTTSQSFVMWKNIITGTLIVILGIIIFPSIKKYYLSYRMKKRAVGMSIPDVHLDMPILLGSYLYDRALTAEGFVAILIDFAERGYLKITLKNNDKKVVTGDDYLIEKTTKRTNQLTPREKNFLDKLFLEQKSFLVSEFRLRTNFMSEIEKDVHDELLAEQYLLRDIHARMTYYLIASIALIVIGRTLTEYHWTFVFLGICTLLLGWFLPRETEKGLRARDKVKKFRVMLKTCLRHENVSKDAPTRKKFIANNLPYVVFFAPHEWSPLYNASEDAREWFIDAHEYPQGLYRALSQIVRIAESVRGENTEEAHV